VVAVLDLIVTDFVRFVENHLVRPQILFMAPAGNFLTYLPDENVISLVMRRERYYSKQQTCSRNFEI
jgi:hypothetical protein